MAKSRYTGRPSKYRKKLQNDPYWKRVKKAVDKRDSKPIKIQGIVRSLPVCRDCGAWKNIEHHHVSYMHFGNELEHLQDVICLCSNCHTKRHRKV